MKKPSPKTTKKPAKKTAAPKASAKRGHNAHGSADAPIPFKPTEVPAPFVGADDAKFLQMLNTASAMPGALMKMRQSLFEAEIYDTKELQGYLKQLGEKAGGEPNYSLAELEQIRQMAWWAVVRATRALMWRDGADRVVIEADTAPRYTSTGTFVPPSNRTVNKLHRTA